MNQDAVRISGVVTARQATRSDELRDHLEEMILDGRLAPGERLDEMELSRRFGLSRTPVREAIKSLLAIGLIETRGRQGTHVALLSIPAIIEMFDVMASLEGLCAKLAARRATPVERAGMRTVHDKLVKAYEAGDPVAFYKVNQQFHDLLYEAAHTHFIAEQAIQLRRRIGAYRMRATYQPGRMLGTLTEHVRIMDAIDAGDPEAAQKAASDHVQLLGDQLTDFISSLPQRIGVAQ
ncbi:GntR family transcriptional regulator [Neorhizobium galegae]|uniref:GntR family transcriptional regulator n=1 Tax=Neorhizobium galegae TaxID=399 RepID=UPI000627C058|nr:GntR family transcriptional regulator [Neorhizobium galegae]MCQ1574523.1 GntR family transcriptional regulator [Neorhizobium galegae]MCQ1810304.1 GntR family transcriptional regulator [Neorhizobium galegae]MCQ1838876.1 GntR family transcriptional regulator [Neorhizobium galegae]UIK08265.1 GntR family transcriptional regulator [Neorhizobium galegae]UIY32224.1 GntR family transcriptional regulator [Neorhizobium galegae]